MQLWKQEVGVMRKRSQAKECGMSPEARGNKEIVSPLQLPKETIPPDPLTLAQLTDWELLASVTTGEQIVLF